VGRPRSQEEATEFLERPQREQQHSIMTNDEIAKICRRAASVVRYTAVSHEPPEQLAAELEAAATHLETPADEPARAGRPR